MFAENPRFIKNDFLPIFSSYILNLITITFYHLKYYLLAGNNITEFNNSFEFLCLAMKKFRKIVIEEEQAYYCLKSFFSERESLNCLLFFILHDPVQCKKITEDKEFLDILLNFSMDSLYMITEIAALQAYDPEVILFIKLKSLVYLDKTGKRVYQNSTIKSIEKYWPDELKKVWETKFSIEKDFGSNSIEKRVVCVKENQGKLPFIYKP